MDLQFLVKKKKGFLVKAFRKHLQNKIGITTTVLMEEVVTKDGKKRFCNGLYNLVW